MTQRLPYFAEQKRRVEDICIDDHYNKAPKEGCPPPLVFSYPVVDEIFIMELVADVNVLHFVVVFIVDIQM